MQSANSVGVTIILANEWQASAEFSREFSALLPSKSFGDGTYGLNSLENLMFYSLPSDDEIGITIARGGFKVVGKRLSNAAQSIGVLGRNGVVFANG